MAMVYVYMNTVTGRELVRPRPDRWLDESAGWVRVEGVPLEDDVSGASDGAQEDEYGWS